MSTRKSSTDTDNTSSSIAQRLSDPDSINLCHRFRELKFIGRVFIVTGGARGLGLTLAEGLVEEGGQVYCLDRLEEPDKAFYEKRDQLAQKFGDSLHYRKVDVQHASDLNDVVAEIAGKHSRLDGLVAAAGVQRVTKALDYPPEKITEMMNINFGGVYLSAQACARQMIKYKTPGAMVLVGSMSGKVANRGLYCSVYNASKAAVEQLGRSLAMEWGQAIDGKPIRVNVLCPGNINTPMVQKNFEDEPHLKELWESSNMLGRISDPEEFQEAVVCMLSPKSSFMTGSCMLVDGGFTAW
ncbi:hypothetical protein M409DRAFT_21841 [Zasmidium cellare ATCC 36951]|uniref:Uncharacterized protein n=1 Tax=Zasmidium cellare ATCC 36951 TaxID=1080233 RepID=A0A6A6CN86_ZASCE|nr:uncharacterized protein M409DRAFT_21841 [Zasmidium cellare ATCC 36951]KAF2167688.1 hypothetical protein M409DRAFT_21841 [Zasmidium cellare ATCC 36951]